MNYNIYIYIYARTNWKSCKTSTVIYFTQTQSAHFCFMAAYESELCILWLWAQDEWVRVWEKEKEKVAWETAIWRAQQIYKI